MRRIPLSRPWIWACAAAGFVVVAVLSSLFVVYPRVGAAKIRSRVHALAARIDRSIDLGSISVSVGRAVLQGVSVRGPKDGDTPLLHIDRIDVHFDGWSSLLGKVDLAESTIDGVVINLRRDASGRDNVQDLIARLRSTSGSKGPSARKVRPTKVTVSHIRLVANDDRNGATALVADGDATWTKELFVATGRGVTFTTIDAPKLSLASIQLRYPEGQAPVLALDGGEVSLLPQLALSGISGTIRAGEHKGRYVLDVAGGYGGVPGKLWTAKGEFDPTAVVARVDLAAEKFQLDRLAPILAHSAIVDYQSTSIDTSLHVEADAAGARFDGQFHLHGLNVGHPYIASAEVHDLDLSGQLAGSFDRASRRFELTKGDFIARKVQFSLTGAATMLGAAQPLPAPKKNADGSDRFPPIRGSHGVQRISAHLVIPPVECQRMIDAFPPEMVPYMAGYRLRGQFELDIRTEIDWSDLDAVVLDGAIGINRCKVIDEPDDSPARLKSEFEHLVETEKGQWRAFVVGPSNPDFVPLDQISPYVRKSIQSSEDFSFYRHRGFIPSEFRTALMNNLKRQKFAQGASSITMQMVKNVLLFREKTLARKLQELFLTWHVENTLDKDRIFEIYLNAIEFGPGLYGIGPAARYYFGKPASDLDPVEAAFFSSILPNPKGRSAQFCSNALTQWTIKKIGNMLQNQRKRNLLTQEEYDRATLTPLVFYKDGDSESEEDCLKRVKNAVKNARSTNPLAETSDVANPTARRPRR